MKRRGLAAFFLIAFGYTWGLGALYFAFPGKMVAIFGPIGFGNPLVYGAVWSPTLAAIIVSAVLGWATLRDLFARLFRWRIGVRWYALAILGSAALAFAARYLSVAFAHTPAPPLFDFAHWPAWIGAGLVAFLYDPGPLGEELGWRGFALPRLLARYNGLTAALVLGLIWGTWHLPAFFIPGMPQHELPLWSFLVASMALTVLMTWVVANARGSVLPAILIHWAFNRFEDLHYPGAIYTTAVLVVAAAAVVFFAGVNLNADKLPLPPE